MFIIAQMPLIIKQPHILKDLFSKICFEAVIDGLVVGNGTQEHLVPYGFIDATPGKPFSSRRIVDRA